MNIEEFESALAALDWKQSDFCRKSGVDRSTTSRWKNGRTPIPDWVPSYLAAMRAIQQLYDTVVKPEKPGESEGCKDIGVTKNE